MRRSPLTIVYLTVFIDLLGLGIILPVLPFYAQSFGASGFAVGATLALYSAMQLVSSPLLGAFSDRVGRRPVLLASLAGSAISLALTGLAGSLPVLLLARALSGLFGGSIGTAQAYVADVTPPAERARAMGLIGAMTGLGFIFGPALGASLSQFGLGTAAFVAAGLAAGNFLLAWFFLPESRPAGVAPRRPVFAFLRVGEALAHPAVGRLFGAMFLAMFAFAGVQATFPLLGAQNFALTASSLGVVFVTVGLVSVLMQGLLVGRLTKRFGERTLALIGLGVFVVTLLTLPLVHSLTEALAVLALQSVGSALYNPALTSLISREAPPDEKGSLLGLGQAFGALSRATGPFVAGFLYDYGSALPFLVGALLVAIGIAVLVRLPAPADVLAPQPAD
ncbi:MAG: tetracycline resistance MFS efflux pump [Dehalococcoidia bacterium]|nr:MAG: tetracycline resistance MFS efflux pump [Dehalococcoidia bacterium]